ncbi:MAG TPA: hypothetical protein VEJ18_10125 [Planctomycetota bacterium]|nr:hypothetical protein [Planctomycetota bacterium]
MTLTPQDTPLRFCSQLLGELDRQVGEGFTVGGVGRPVKVTEKGHLEVDVRGDGKPRTITSKREIVAFAVKGGGDKPKTLNAKFEFRKGEDGSWTVRNLTILLARIGTEQFVVVDADADGLYNEPGVDGLTWAGKTWLFPLPSPAERWCSETMDFTGLTFGPAGEEPSVQGRLLATTTAAALPVLKGVNAERVEIGLTPRPEDLKLSADLQKHCAYMALNGTLTHPETKGRPGYSEEGHAAGMRSILSSGTPADRVAAGMMATYFHRQDVIRPDTAGFGVGYEGVYGGIDGRTKLSSPPNKTWPVICPVPDQTVPTHFNRESPDPIPGDREAGFPITAYFGTDQLTLKAHSLRALAGPGVPPSRTGHPVECYTFDPRTGSEPSMTRYQRVVALIPKDPLRTGAEYEVMLEVDVAGTPWKKTWRFKVLSN